MKGSPPAKPPLATPCALELKSRAARKRKEAENPAKYAAEYARSLQIAAAHLAKQAEQEARVQPSPDCKRRRKCDSVAEALSDVLGGAVPPGVRLRGTPAHLAAQMAGLCRFLRMFAQHPPPASAVMYTGLGSSGGQIGEEWASKFWRHEPSFRHADGTALTRKEARQAFPLNGGSMTCTRLASVADRSVAEELEVLVFRAMIMLGVPRDNIIQRIPSGSAKTSTVAPFWNFVWWIDLEKMPNEFMFTHRRRVKDSARCGFVHPCIQQSIAEMVAAPDVQSKLAIIDALPARVAAAPHGASTECRSQTVDGPPPITQAMWLTQLVKSGQLVASNVAVCINGHRQHAFVRADVHKVTLVDPFYREFHVIAWSHGRVQFAADGGRLFTAPVTAYTPANTLASATAMTDQYFKAKGRTRGGQEGYRRVC